MLTIKTRVAIVVAALGLTTAPVFSVPAAADSPAESAAPSPANSASVAPTTPSINGEGDFARVVLERSGWPVSGENMCALVAWQVAEGGHFVPGSTTFNPLNTSQSMPGDSVFNSHGVRNYPDWETGIQATVRTLQYDFYSGIRAALAAGNNAVAVLQAVSDSPWGTKFSDVGSAIGRCSQWAAEFDRFRAEAQAAVDRASAEVVRAKGLVEDARFEETRLAEQHRQMAAEIETARHSLGQFARRLYISGMEPAIADQVDTLTSGDPISHELLKNYPQVIAARDSQSLRRSFTLLAQVDASQHRSAEVTAAATAEMSAAEARLAQAVTDLNRVGDRVAELN
ncbi:MAG: hypothetical protein Q8P61_05460 [Candidatus Nanopelagicales bacterium]|nr:hypothetical protein [Candidatus Nanopelagicales bacterium]